jgi:hypothetical protein
VANADNTEYTQEDEAKMDRAAQSGAEGAFGAPSDSAETVDQMREDAEAAFGDTDASGASSTGSSGSTSSGGASSGSNSGGEMSSGVNLSGGSGSKP